MYYLVNNVTVLITSVAATLCIHIYYIDTVEKHVNADIIKYLTLTDQ